MCVTAWNERGEQVFSMLYTLKLLSKDFLFLSSTNKFYITFHPTAGDKIYHVRSDGAYG